MSTKTRNSKMQTAFIPKPELYIWIDVYRGRKNIFINIIASSNHLFLSNTAYTLVWLPFDVIIERYCIFFCEKRDSNNLRIYSKKRKIKWRSFMYYVKQESTQVFILKTKICLPSSGEIPKTSRNFSKEHRISLLTDKIWVTHAVNEKINRSAIHAKYNLILINCTD